MNLMSIGGRTGNLFGKLCFSSSQRRERVIVSTVVIRKVLVPDLGVYEPERDLKSERYKAFRLRAARVEWMDNVY